MPGGVRGRLAGPPRPRSVYWGVRATEPPEKGRAGPGGPQAPPGRGGSPPRTWDRLPGRDREDLIFEGGDPTLSPRGGGLPATRRGQRGNISGAGVRKSLIRKTFGRVFCIL